MKKFVVLFFACVLFLSGCGGGGPVPGMPGASSTGNPVSDSVAKEMGEQMAEEMLGGVDIEFAEEGSGESVAWPSDMPSDVPVFKYGKIDATMATPDDETGNSIVMQFREVEDGAYDKYEQDLIGAGWTIITDSAWEDEHITAEKGDRDIDVDVDPMGENTAFLYYME